MSICSSPMPVPSSRYLMRLSGKMLLKLNGAWLLFILILLLWQKLHEMGARKIGYVGLPPIGCVPSQRTVGGGLERNCEPKRNYAAQLYNYKIQVEIDQILKGPSYKGSKITYIDIYNILLDMIQRPGFYGKLFLQILFSSFKKVTIS